MREERSLEENIRIIGDSAGEDGDSAAASMEDLVRFCEENNIPQPDVRQFLDSGGLQAAWEDAEWYFELNCDGEDISATLAYGGILDGAMTCSFRSIRDAERYALLLFRKVFRREDEASLRYILDNKVQGEYHVEKRRRT